MILKMFIKKTGQQSNKGLAVQMVAMCEYIVLNENAPFVFPDSGVKVQSSKCKSAFKRKGHDHIALFAQTLSNSIFRSE